jgi:hypothetical protein
MSSTSKQNASTKESGSQPTQSLTAKQAGSLEQLSREDLDETVFYIKVDALSDKLTTCIMDNVEATAEGYAVALEAVQELYQTLLSVPVYDKLEALGDTDGVDKLLRGETM